MKKNHILFLSTIIITCLPLTSFAWGFWAHQRINRLAVFTLPPEMLGLYKKNIEFLTEHAVDPDKRRYAVDGEAAHHFIDVDHYGEYPFENVPRYWEDAVKKFGKDTLEAYGVVPYHLPTVVIRLKKAFERKDLISILKISSDLGHYVGDSHVPLHTTENYNGQMTGQKGIHGFWESRLPELFGEEYDFFVGQCYYVEDLYNESWKFVLESHSLLDSVLDLEKKLSQEYPADKRYSYESRNNIVVRTYSREYSEVYHRKMDGMVEKRMRQAILRVGSYWYTAWRLAGSPDLSELLEQKIESKPKRYKNLLKILDREAQDIGFLFDGCCAKPIRKAQAFGMYRTMSCVQDDPRYELLVGEMATKKGSNKKSPWYKKLWNWLFG
ncbi:MAG: zinc dependent phospholipase C family protein [Bacteroidia bacterium]|nr:zinc dependent phospholipase C family protein [Bacteroidia bacterium]